MMLGEAAHATFSRCGPALRDWERGQSVRQLKIRCYRFETRRSAALIKDEAYEKKIHGEIAYTRQRQGLPPLKKYRGE